MASRIVPTNIDGTFPVAGQDNPSQGFRDNFTNIKNNFTFARNEISDLQDKVIVKSALAGTTLDNDMTGTQLVHPQLKSWTQALVDLGAISGNVTIPFSSGNFQKITTAGSISLTLNDWPTTVTGYGLVRVWIVATNVAHTVTLPTNVDIGANDIAGYNPANHTITFDAAGNYVFDFSSIDSGANFLIADKFWVGAMYRSGVAVGFNAQWIINKKLRFGYAYDITTTDLQNYSKGVHEVMVTYELVIVKRRYISPRYF